MRFILSLKKMVFKKDKAFKRVFPFCYKEVENSFIKNVEAHSTFGNTVVYKPKYKREKAIVFYHGGGWVGGDSTQLGIYAEEFAKLGYTCYNVNYRLSDLKNVWYEDVLRDSELALSRVKEKDITVVGGSAGGQIACMLNDKRIKSLVLLNPAVDTVGIQRPYSDVFRGAGALYSPLLLNLMLPPTIVVHGTADKIVPYPLVEKFSISKGADLRTYEGEPHAFYYRPDTLQEMLSVIKEGVEL